MDQGLQGGFLTGSVVVLSAPAGDEVPFLLRNFLQAEQEASMLVCRTLSSAEIVTHDLAANVKSLVCSDKPIPPSKNMISGKGIDNLTDVNFQIADALGSVQPKRVVLDVLSDVLLRHKGLQTRKWLTELLERFRSKNITTLAVLNPFMHSSEDVQAVVDLFDGNLEIMEKEVEGTLRKFLCTKWMHGIDVTEKELPLLDLIPASEAPGETVARPTSLRQPRWTTSLVNRADEFTKLKTAFQDAVAGRAYAVAIQGEAGVGKTRLMRELGAFVQGQSALILAGRAGEEKIPYGPFVEILREYTGQVPGEVLRRVLGGRASEIARLVPDITAKVGTVPPSKPLGEAQDRLRLFEAVTQSLISVCSESPLLLLLDDMQHADQASLDLFEYFVRSTSNAHILTLLAYRTEDVTASSALSKTLMKLNKERLLESVSIKNLTKGEVTELVEQIFGEKAISLEFSGLVYERTGGNPFFVEEVLRALVEDGTIFRAEKGWDRKPIQDIVVPESVRTALRSRLTKLDPEAMVVLQWAAVIGSEFDFDVLRQASQINEDTLLERLETVASQGLILEVPQQRSKFRFADNRIRELLLDDILQIKRGRYHLKVAEAMEKLYSKSPERFAEAIANHFSEGGDTTRTIKYSMIAGDTNRAIHVYEQAISDYRRALEVIDLEGGNDEQKPEILQKLGACYSFLGRLQESTQCYEKALAVYEKLHDNQGCARVCRGIAEAIARVKAESGTLEAASVLRKGLEYIKGETETAEAASTYLELAWNLAVLDQWDEGLAWAEKAREVGEKTQNLAAIAGTLPIKASFLTDTGKIDDGLKLWEEAYVAGLKLEDLNLTRSAVFNLSIYVYPRSLAKAREWALKGLEIGKRANVVLWEARALWWLAVLDWLAGDWVDALDKIEKSSSIFERPGTGGLGAWEIGAWRGLFLLSMGDLASAERLLEWGQRAVEETPKVTVIVTINLAFGLLRLEQGKEDEALVLFERAVDTFKAYEYTTEPLLHIETLLHLTGLYGKRGEFEKAQKTLEWAGRLAETLGSDAGLAMVSQAKAILLHARGDGKGAEEAFQECLGLWEKAGWPYYKAKALVAYSDAIVQTNPEESTRRIREAAGIFGKLGAKRDLQKAEAKLSPKPNPS